MTINKISRSGSSVVTLAELKSGSAVFVQKVGRVSTAGPVITGGLVSQADIIKRGLQVQTVVGRAIANPYGSIFTFFDRLGLSDEAILLLARQVALADEFFITHNTPKFLLNKGLNDSEPILERISLRIAAFRVFEDAQFVSTATKFTLTRPLADSQSLIDTTRISAGYQRAAADIQTIVDTRRSIGIGKGNQDTVTQSDSIAKRGTALKQDQTITTEAKALLPGKALFDGVTVRNHDDPGPALFVTKLLRDATTILDLTGIFDGLTYQNIMYRFDAVTASDNFSRTIAANRRFNESQSIVEKIFLQRGVIYQDITTPADNKQLSITVQRSDTIVVTEALQRVFLAQRVFQDTGIISEVKSLTAGLGKTDVATMLERLANAVGKVNADATIVTENISKSPIKALIDSIISTEAIAKLINKGLTDEVTIIEDILILLINFIRVNADSVDTLNSQPIFSVGKRLTDTTINLEQNFKLIGKSAEDSLSTINNQPLFTVSKYLADIASMSDLAAAFDGITYNYGLGRLDTAQATDEFIRQFTAFRTLRETVSISDVLTKARGIGFAARTDTATVTDSIIRGTLKFETLFIGSRQNQRSRAEERISFNITLPIKTQYRTLIDELNFFSGYEEYLFSYVVPAGQSFAGSTIFASTSASAFVQVTSSGTGAGTNGGFATLYGNYYISFNGTGTRSVTTIPLNLTIVSSASITFSVIAGNMSNGGEQPDLNENLVVEYSIDAGASFVTAATIQAIDTYAYSSWFQFSTSLPVAAITSSTLLRWRQTQQSLGSGDNYGITDIRLGSTSFGTFARTYNDNNTVITADYLVRGQFRNLSSTARLLPTGYFTPATPIFERWDQQANAFLTADTNTSITNLAVNSVVHSSSTGFWFATARDNYRFLLKSTDGINWTNATDLASTQRFYLGQDTTGQVLIACSEEGATDTSTGTMFWSGNGGSSWTAYAMIGDSRYENNQRTSKTSINNNARYNSIPLFISGRATPTFIHTYPINSGGTTTSYAYAFSSSNATSAQGQSWARGGTFPDSWTSSNSQRTDNGKTSIYIEPLGLAYGSGVAVVHLQNYDLTLSKIYYLSDASPFPANFSLSTSITNRLITGTTSTNAGYQVYARPNLAFGAGRFVWISPHGNVLTTTSPTVTASWQHYTVETTGLGIFASIAWDRIKQQFIIARNGTSSAVSGFWYSTSGTQSSWTFKNSDTLRVNAISFNSSNAMIWPSTKVYLTSGSTSIAQAVTTFRGYVNQVGQLYTGAYYELADYKNDIDRITFGYGKEFRQDSLFYGSPSVANPVPALATVTSFLTTNTLVSSYTITHWGNKVPWSPRLARSFTVVLYNLQVGVDAGPNPEGYYNDANIVTVTATPDATIGSFQGYTINTSTPVIVISAWVKGIGSSIGRLVALGTNSPNQTTAFTLTANWQRIHMAVDYTANVGNYVNTQANITLNRNQNYGNSTSANMLVGQSMWLWGYMINETSQSLTYTPGPFVRTTGLTLAAGTANVNDYVTSTVYTNDLGVIRRTYMSQTLYTSYSTILQGNCLLYSQDFTNAFWTTSNYAITPNAFLAPDGTTSATQFVVNASGWGQSFYTGDIKPFKNGVYFNHSFWVKGYGSSIGSYGSAYYNENGTLKAGVIFQLTENWIRYSYSFLCTLDNPTDIYSRTLNLTFSGDSYQTPAVGGGNLGPQQGYYLWGMQLTTGTALQAYTPTTSATRIADVSPTAYSESDYNLAYEFTTTVTRLFGQTTEPITFAIGKSVLLDPANMADSLKSVVSTILSPARANSAEILPVADRIAKAVTLTAYRSVVGQVQLKTINAAGNQAQSSVLFSYGARSPDVIGTIDLIFVAIIKTSTFADSISIGNDIDQRQFNTERISFAITKANTDTIAIDERPFKTLTKVNRDTAIVTDRSVSTIALNKTDTVSTSDVFSTARGKGLVEIVTVVDNVAQQISLLKTEVQSIIDNRVLDISLTKTEAVTASQTLIALDISKPLSDISGVDDQQFKAVTKVNTELLDTGADRTNFDVALTAYRGVAGTVTLNTIDPTPDVEFEQSSVTVVRGARSPDEVGMLDLFSLFYVINRSIEDTVAAADQRTFFTISKVFADSFLPDDFLATFDGLTYAGFMMRQDYIDAAQRVFMDVVLGTKTESIGIADRSVLVYNKPVADNIAIADATRNSIALLKTESQLILDFKNFDVSKLLQETETVLDTLSLLNASSRSVQDSISASDRSVLSIAKYNVENIAANDVLALLYISNKFFFELVYNQDDKQLLLAKVVNNSVLGSDQTVFVQTKTLADSVAVIDVNKLDISLVKTDVQSLDDQRTLTVSLVKSDAAALADVARLVGTLNKSDNLVVSQAPVYFTITKLLSDSFVPDDFLQTFDGLTYAYATSRYDEITTAQRVLFDVVLGTKSDTVFSLEQILVAQLKHYDDSIAEADQLQLRIDNLINNVAIAADVQRFDVAANKADFITSGESKYFDISKLATPDTVDVADLKRLGIANVINNVAIAADVQKFDVTAVRTDTAVSNERKYLDFSKPVSPETISLADLIKLVLTIPTPLKYYFDDVFVSDAAFLSISKSLSEVVTVADNKALDVAIVAHRGVAGTLILNTIDPSPDVEFEQSSVTVSRSSMDTDAVGTLDFFSLTYSTVRSIEDSIAIAEVAKFAITKLLNDATVPDDFLQTFDGLTYATTILKQDVISIALPGFTGNRVSGDNRERIVLDISLPRNDAVSSTDTRFSLVPGKSNSDAVQELDTLVLSISLSKTETQVVAETQRFFDISLPKTETIVNQDALRKNVGKSLGTEEILSITDLVAFAARILKTDVQTVTESQRFFDISQAKTDQLTSADALRRDINKLLADTATITDLLALQAQYRLSLAEIQYILGEKAGNFRYLLAQPKSDQLSTSGDRLASFITKDLTNLDGLNNINTMVSNGTLRMTDYADIDYFAEDYVGASRSFT